MTADELRSLRRRLGLSQTKAAASIDVSARTWQSWEGGERPIPSRMALLIALVHEARPQGALPYGVRW